MNLTFKDHLALMEARGGGRKYTEKQVKNVLDRVTVTLAGSEAGNMTKLARRFARLDASLKALKEQHDTLNARLKDDIQEMFNAEDTVLTRVVETAQFTLTMAKEIPKTEGSKEVDYASIIAALSALVSDELQPRIDGIIEKYTKIIPPKAPVKRLSVSKDLVKEGVLGNLTNMIKSFVKSIMSWATRYDAKLESLKRKAGKSMKVAELFQPSMMYNTLMEQNDIVQYDTETSRFDLSMRGKPVILKSTRMHGPQTLIGRREDVTKFVKRAKGQVSDIKNASDYTVSEVTVTGKRNGARPDQHLSAGDVKGKAHYFNEDGGDVALIDAKPGRGQVGTVVMTMIHRGSIESALKEFHGLNLSVVSDDGADYKNNSDYKAIAAKFDATEGKGKVTFKIDDSRTLVVMMNGYVRFLIAGDDRARMILKPDEGSQQERLDAAFKAANDWVKKKA